MPLTLEQSLLIEDASALSSLTVSEFLKEVCSKYDDDTAKSVDIFLETLVQLLLKFSELLPSLRIQLSKIIRVLVDYGVQYRSTLLSNREMGNQREVEKLKSCSGMDRHKYGFSILYDLDKKIADLQDTKIQIYNELINKDFNINIKNEPIDNATDIKSTSCTQTTSNRAFHPSAIKMTEKSLEMKTSSYCHSDDASLNSAENDEPVKEKKKKKAINEKFEEKQEEKINKVVNKAKNNAQEKKKRKKSANKDDTETVVSLVSSNKDLKNKESIPKHLINMHNLSSPISCLKVHKDLCIAGCENGQLQIFSCKSRNLNDSIQAHAMPVTSLVIWNNIIVTSSLDQSLKSFNLKKNCKNEVVIDHPIETTTDDLNGVLFAGTSSGKIYRFNILSMTQIGVMFHISSTKILSIKTFNHGFKVLLVVSAENRPITIRNAESGALLKTLLVKNTISFDISRQEMLWFGISEERIYGMSLHSPEKIEIASNKCLSQVCTYGNLILVCASDGNLYFYNKDLILYKKVLIGLRDDITAISSWKNFIIISFKNLKNVKMYNLNQIDGFTETSEIV